MPDYTGNNGDNTINGSNGNDTISGEGGDDTLNGGNGNDTVSGGEGEDDIDGGNGNDTLDGGSGDDEIEGGNGDDDIEGGSGEDELDGGNGDDSIDGGDDDDIILGGNGGDTLVGGGGDDELYGQNGNDFLTGGAGNDLLDGNNGFDIAYYSGAIGEYSFYSAAGYLHVVHQGGAGADGHDQLIRVERLVFADRVINIGSGNNAPVAGDDHVFINEDTGVYNSGAASVKDNDFDFDGDALTVTGGVFVGTYGTLTLNANGTYSYTLNAGAQALAQGQTVTDSFNYTVSDNDGSDTGALVFHIAGVNDAPTANPDTDSTSENAVLTVDVLANDTDVDNGAVLTVTAASAPVGQGTASVVGNQVEFDQGTDFDDLAVGDSEVVVISYDIEDEHGATSSSTLTITVTGTNDGPVANPDTDSTSENAVLTVDVLANDTDVDNGAVLTVTAASVPLGQGTATVVGNQVEFDPGTDFDDLNVGDSEVVVVSYTIEDEHGASSSSTLTITVTGTNDGPVANPDTDTTSENATILVDVLANDTDVDNGAVLTVTAASAPVGQGTASVVGNQVEFDPGTDFDDLAVGESEVVVVSYDIEDEHGATSSSTLTITVTGTNDGPVANPDTDSTSENAAITVDVLANDTDVDNGAVLTVTAASAPVGQGTASVVGNQVEFDPGTDFDDLAVGDSEVVVISYDIEDEHGATSSSTLTITVTGTNDGPVANPDTDSTSENAAITVDVLANDTDVDDGAVLTVTAASAPVGQGTATVVGNQVEFDPGSDFDYLADGESAVVVVSYDIEDEHGASSSSTLTVTVNGTNDAPTIDAGGTDATGAVTELPNNDPGENTDVLSDSGTIAFDDLDLSDTHTASFMPDAGGYLGTFTLDPVNQAGDTVGWDFSVSDADLDFLDDGETLVQTYTVEIDDGNGGTTTQDVTVTLTGAADGPQTDWYIDNSAVGSANLGTQGDPYTSIAAFNAAQGTLGGPQVGHTVYLLAGTGTYTEADGLNLLDDQVVIGVADGPVRPTIVVTGAGNDGIEVAENNTISGLDIGNTNDAGIVDSNGTVGTLTITDVGKFGTGQVVDIDQGGTLNVTLNSAESLASNDGAIDLAGVGGTFTVTGATTITGIHSDGGIDITGSSLTATFAGGGTVSTNNAIAVNFVGNTGALELGGGLDIVTTTGKGLNATGGGTLTVTGGGNSVTSLTGTAVTISGTTIGAADVTFESVSSNGAVNGIVLTNTGSAGGFSITGDGGGINNGSGGTIQNSTGDGILLTNTENFQIAYVNIQNGADNGIGGTNINGFVLDHVNVTANGNAAATDDSGIDIANLFGSGSAGSHVTMISNTVISNNHEFEVQITNTSGTLTNLQVDNSTFSSNGAGGAHGNLFNFLALGTSSMGISVSGSTFDGNTVVGALTGTGLNMDASGGSIQADVGTSNFIENNTGVNVTAATTGTLLFNVHDNVLTGSRGNAINFGTSSGASGTINGTIQDNVVGTLGVAGSGSLLGRGVNVTTSGGGTVNLLVDDNTIQATTSLEGISVVDNVTAGIVNVTITDNIIRDIPAPARGINVQTAGAGNTINSSVSGNQFISVPGPADTTVLRFNEGVGSTLNVTQLAPSAAADPNEVDDANGIANTRVSIAGTPQFGQPAPTLPSLPSLPLLAPEEAGGGAVDDLTQSELDAVAAAAIERWEDAGASADQLAAMRATTVTVADMGGLYLGASAPGAIQIDRDAVGYGWFVDETPGEDSEFDGEGFALDGGAADGRMDLLTVLMHEFGHQAGLGHDAGELMEDTLGTGERRLPDGAFETGTPPSGGEEWIGLQVAGSELGIVYPEGPLI